MPPCLVHGVGPSYLRQRAVAGQHNGSPKAVVVSLIAEMRDGIRGTDPGERPRYTPHADRNRSSGPVQQLQENARSHDGHPRRPDPRPEFSISGDDNHVIVGAPRPDAGDHLHYFRVTVGFGRDHLDAVDGADALRLSFYDNHYPRPPGPFPAAGQAEFSAGNPRPRQRGQLAEQTFRGAPAITPPAIRAGADHVRRVHDEHQLAVQLFTQGRPRRPEGPMRRQVRDLVRSYPSLLRSLGNGGSFPHRLPGGRQHT
ncbi:MAG: hypothetical protein ACRDRO_14280 [Pseudonocardiaceae bacterium]